MVEMAQSCQEILALTWLFCQENMGPLRAPNPNRATSSILSIVVPTNRKELINLPVLENQLGMCETLVRPVLELRRGWRTYFLCLTLVLLPLAPSIWFTHDLREHPESYVNAWLVLVATLVILVFWFATQRYVIKFTTLRDDRQKLHPQPGSMHAIVGFTPKQFDVDRGFVCVEAGALRFSGATHSFDLPLKSVIATGICRTISNIPALRVRWQCEDMGEFLTILPTQGSWRKQLNNVERLAEEMRQQRASATTNYARKLPLKSSDLKFYKYDQPKSVPTVRQLKVFLFLLCVGLTILRGVSYVFGLSFASIWPICLIAPISYIYGWVIVSSVKSSKERHKVPT